MKYNQTAARSQSSVAFSSLTDLQAQIVNSLCVGLAACAIVAGTGNQEDWMPLRMLLIFTGGVFGLKSVLDMLHEVVSTWVQPRAQLEVTHVGETLAERQARMECVLLLEESRKIFGGDSRQIASDDKLKWGSTRRLRVVNYLNKHTIKENKGASRGTFLRDYTLSETITMLREKKLALTI